MPRIFPHQSPRNVAGAIYGLILGSSIIAGVGTDHPGRPGLVEIYLCATAVVFYLAHVYARVIGSWVEGQAPNRAAVRAQLSEEWPMVSAQILPAAMLLLGALGLVAGNVAISLALAISLAELMAAVVYACWRAEATTRQAAVSILVAALFALGVILLKIFVHG